MTPQTEQFEKSMIDPSAEKPQHIVFVAVDTDNRGESPEAEDNYIPGLYKIGVRDAIIKGQLGEVALDIFHSRVPIRCLDRFVIIPYDGNFNELPRDPSYKAFPRPMNGTETCIKRTQLQKE